MFRKEQIMQSERFQELMKLVEEKYAELQPDVSSRKAAMEQELQELTDQRRGWRFSLGNPDLPDEARRELEEDLNRAIARSDEIERKLSEIESSAVQKTAALDREVVAEHLARLSQLMEGDNAAATNVMLSQHIGAIECDVDGQVVVRCCHLGALANPEQSASALREMDDAPDEPRRGRRRTRRDVGAALNDDEAIAANDFAVDPHRYDGLGPEWFTEDVFHVPEKLTWAEEHAREVAEYRLKHKVTMPVTAEHFKKSVYIIRKALRYAKEKHGLDALGKEISLPTRQNWSRDNAQRVAEFFNQPGATMKAAVDVFGTSPPTISKAKDFAEELDNEALDPDDPNP